MSKQYPKGREVLELAVTESDDPNVRAVIAMFEHCNRKTMTAQECQDWLRMKKKDDLRDRTFRRACRAGAFKRVKP